ncbi:hypothetical protein ABN357_19645 [Providencia rettgeri]|uniref:Uncharacterized protein n=1 Tax=Providencia rettgeri TaxID=587 RepID=A0AB35L7E9_PRORE|nr:hypothetical protein [Providencia rettgeri]MDH2305039.1 hypothetical protein [Providencia rettgeri]
MRITTTVKNKDDNELIRFTGNCLSDFLMRNEKEYAYMIGNMQAWIVRKKSGNISVKGYRK